MAEDRRRQPSLLQMLQQNDEKHEAAHTRLRLAHDRLDARLDAIDAACLKLEHRLSTLEKAPTELSNIRFTPQLVIWIVGAFLSVSGGMWASTYGLRSDVRDLLTRGDAQAKLEETRADTLTKAIDEMKRRVELQQFEIQSLKDVLVKQQPLPTTGGRR